MGQLVIYKKRKKVLGKLVMVVAILAIVYVFFAMQNFTNNNEKNSTEIICEYPKM